MDAIQIGYARVSTADQDLTAQRDGLLRLGVDDVNIYVDHGMTGANCARPGLREALAAVRAGDTLVVTKLDRLARSLRDAREIADELTAKGVALSLGGSRCDPTDPVGRLLFNVLAMVAEFERDLISMRTREGMAVARAKGRLKGKQPKLSGPQRKLLFETYDRAEFSQTELAALFSVSRATVYRPTRGGSSEDVARDATGLCDLPTLSCSLQDIARNHLSGRAPFVDVSDARSDCLCGKVMGMRGRIWSLISAGIGAVILVLLALYGTEYGTWVDEAGRLPTSPPSFVLPFAVGALAAVLLIGGVFTAVTPGRAPRA